MLTHVSYTQEAWLDADLFGLLQMDLSFIHEQFRAINKHDELHLNVKEDYAAMWIGASPAQQDHLRFVRSSTTDLCPRTLYVLDDKSTPLLFGLCAAKWRLGLDIRVSTMWDHTLGTSIRSRIRSFNAMFNAHMSPDWMFSQDPLDELRYAASSRRLIGL